MVANRPGGDRGLAVQRSCLLPHVTLGLGRGCVLGPLPVMLAACQNDPFLPSITSPDVPSASRPAGPTRYAYLPERSP